ncbi:hypothetical protein E4U43_008024 [Claviceps pusilla]|uniref:Uncharacterized protein n=1 Tax=Claviceps pusilla TaxID=123648 RepID=A0A9P7NDW4_9HYPO|nr:hypothetical protein E4U43_008024 [Claviceps pusilla]
MDMDDMDMEQTHETHETDEVEVEGISGCTDKAGKERAEPKREGAGLPCLTIVASFLVSQATRRCPPPVIRRYSSPVAGRQPITTITTTHPPDTMPACSHMSMHFVAEEFLSIESLKFAVRNDAARIQPGSYGNSFGTHSPRHANRRMT